MRRIVIAIQVILAFAFTTVTVQASDFYSPYGGSKYHSKTLEKGSYQFEVDGVPNGYSGYWYVNGQHVDSDENLWLADPKYTHYCQSSITIECNIWDDKWDNGGNYVEVHKWYITINYPPTAPSYPDPWDHEPNVNINTDLDWSSSSDPNGDNVDYRVYFGTDATPDNGEYLGVAPGSSYNLSTLNFDKHYYWKIIAFDGKGGETNGAVWDFYTEKNNPPNKPSNPNPPDNATNVPLRPTFSWACSDPDGDNLNYVFKYKKGLTGWNDYPTSNKYFTLPNDFEFGQVYYWKVFAYDEHGELTKSHTDFQNGWKITTKINNPPNKPSNPNPPDNATNVPVNPILSWTGGDPDGDDIIYTVEFKKDCIFCNWETIASSTTNTSVNLTDLDVSTTYKWRVTITDEYGEKTEGDIWIFSTERGFPDLIILNQTSESNNLSPGESFMVSCNVKNNGIADASVSKLIYYLSSDNVFDLFDKPLSSTYIKSAFIGLKTNETIFLTKDLEIPNDNESGNYYILFYADAENRINEGNNENNNIEYVPITINQPSSIINLTVSNVHGGSVLYPGSDGIIELYNENNQLIQTNSTTNGTATFVNIPIGNNYWSYIFHNPQSTMWGREFWGSKTSISIDNNNGNVKEDFTRNMPYIESINAYADGININGQTIAPHTPIKLEIKIRNTGAPRFVKPLIKIDVEKDSEYDYENSYAGYELVEGNDNVRKFKYDLYPQKTGNYYYTIGALTNFSPLDGGYTITDGWGWSISPLFIVQESTAAPEILSDLLSITKAPNESVSFTVIVDGTNLTYQWLKDDSPLTSNERILGLNSETLKITELLTSDAGGYKCQVRNNYGTKTSNEAILTIDESDCILIGELEICATNKSNLDNNTYKLNENVSVNHVLFFDGDLIVDPGNLTIEGDCGIYLDNIQDWGRVDLYKGYFKFSVETKTLVQKDIDEINNMFDMANLPVYIENLELLDDGIKMEGEIEFPYVMNQFRAKVNTLEITESEGINLDGEINLQNIKIHNTVGLEELILKFDTKENNFYGSCNLLLPAFGNIGASTEIKKGKLNSIYMDYSPNPPIPLGTTGFGITEIHGSVDGISDPPLYLTAGVNLAPVVPLADNIVSFDDVSLSYTWGTLIEGSGTMMIFNQNISNAYIKISKDFIEFGGGVELYDLISGNFYLGLYKIYYPEEKIELHGRGRASLILPDKYGFPFGFIRCFVDLPYTLAEVDNYIKNTTIAGNFAVGDYRAHYLLTWEMDRFKTDYGKGYENWNEILFGNNKSYLLMNNKKLSNNRFEGKSLILSKSKSKGGIHEISYNMIQTSSTMILRAFDTTKVDIPYMAIKLPDGNIVTPSNISQYANISFNENINEYKSFYSIENPESGNYSIIINSASDTLLLDVFGAIVPPVIIIDSLERINDTTTIIRWIDSDPDSNAEIALYYDNDNQNANGILIENKILEDDLNNLYTWNHSNISSGIYYIFAIINDSITNSTPVYSPNYIKIVDENAPNPPQDLSYSLSDTSIILTWKNINTVPVNHIVYHALDIEDLNYSSSSQNTGSDTIFEFNNFIPGRTYKFMVTAMDTLELESDYSNSIVVNYTSSILNQAPSIIVRNIPDIIFVDSVYNFQLECNDPDEDTLYYSLINAPNGMHINNSGFITWKPTAYDRGIHSILIKVTDPFNLSDYLFYNITVLELLNNLAVTFNKPKYNCYDDIGFIHLIDASLSLPSKSIDTLSVYISSNANTNGIELKAIETEPNTKIFKTFFEFSSSASYEKLYVFNTDSISLQYINPVLHDTLNEYSYFSDQPLQAPIGVIASNGDYCDKVVISWEHASCVTGYDVYRSNTYLGSTELTYFEDNNPSYDSTTYKIYSNNSSGTSISYGSDDGFAKNIPTISGEISGQDSVLVNSTVTYNVENINGITYHWSTDCGDIDSVNSDIDSVNVTWTSLGNCQLKVIPKNVCGDGPTRILNVTVYEAVGIEENERTNLISIYPNPAQGVIFIDSELKIERIKLFNIQGSVIIDSEFQNEINISEIKSGIYFIKLYSKRGELIKSEKIIIEK